MSNEQEVVMEDLPEGFNNPDIGGLEEFEPGQLVDVYQFEGKQIPIERVKIDKILSKFGPDGKQLPEGQQVLAPILRVETGPVHKGKNSRGEDYEIRASEIFSLKEKKDEKTGKVKVGWSHHPKASLAKFLRKMRVKHPKELPGKLVLLTTRPTADPDVTYLGFVRE